jgi:sulfonate transport system substrate-binding protein
VRTPRRSRWLLLPLSLLLAASACGGDGDGAAAASDSGSDTTLDPAQPLEIPEGVKLVIGDQGQAIETPLRLAGELDDLPYDVEFASFASGPLVNEAIGAGEIDLGGMGDTPALLSFASGLETVVVGVRVTEGSGSSIVAGDGTGIESLEDLEGKRVAYTTGTNTHGFVLRALDSVGLAEDDIEQVDVPLTDLANVLASGQADAAVVYEIFRAAYDKDHPDSTTLIESNDVVPTYSFLLSPRPSVEDPGKLAALEDLVERIGRASLWVKAHPDEWIDAYYVGVQKQTPEAGRAAYEAQGPTTWVDDVDGQPLEDQQDQADLLYANGRLPEEVDMSEQFDDEYSARFSNAIQRGLDSGSTETTETTETTDTETTP